MWVKLNKRLINEPAEPVYVNMDQVTHFIENTEGGYTTLYLTADNTKYIQVVDSITVIASIIGTKYP